MGNNPLDALGLERLTPYWEVMKVVEQRIQERALTIREWRAVRDYLQQCLRGSKLPVPWNRKIAEQAVYHITTQIALAWFREMVARVRKGVRLEPPGVGEAETVRGIFGQAWARYETPCSQEYYECRLVLERVGAVLGVDLESRKSEQ